MSFQKPMMIMGGSIHDIARSNGRFKNKNQMVQNLMGNKFSAAMESQSRLPIANNGSSEMQAARTKALAGLAKLIDASSSGGDPMQKAMTAQSLQTMVGALNQDIAERSSAHTNKNSLTPPSNLTRKRDVLPSSQKNDETLGKLSAQFESGSEGISAIGYDRVGGTSYGKYQIASNTGTMGNFIDFLKTEAPDIASKLQKAGPANTGSRNGEMPKVWRDIAAREPERFAELQENFIKQSHYTPALEAVSKAGFDVNSFSPALKEVMWSTSVQHGANAAARIFIQAAEKVDMNQKSADSNLIRNVYSSRAGQFRSSTEEVQASVRNRLRAEQGLALAMVN